MWMGVRRMKLRTFLIIAGLAGTAILFAAEATTRMEETIFVPYGHKTIQYFETPSDNPVSRLDTEIDKGRTKLAYAANGFGYLPAVLEKLGLNIDSQMLIYSQSSFQAPLISRRRPRALYFDDNISVGFVQGGEVYEITALDPKLGVIFYSLDTKQRAKPSFARREVCLQCHQGAQTLGVPGLVVASAYIPKGVVEHTRGGFVTDGRTDIGDRWGGWYVSGDLGGQPHLGIMIPATPVKPASPDQIIDDQSPDPARYLSPYSDVVALMTLEHQSRMTNILTRIGWDSRIATYDGKLKAFTPQLESEVEEMVKYMLFADEAQLKAPVKGATTFTQTFAAKGPRDKQGRSLRDFDLQTRLFKYPLSYMVYNKAFDALPKVALDRIYQRLFDVLTGKDTSATFAKVSAEDRSAVLDILRETKPNLPPYWKVAAPK